MTLPELWPLFLFIALAALTAGGMLAGAHFLGPRRPNPVKDQPFECGNLGSDPPEGQVPVHFYRVAILFVIFDIEVAFLYPWAVRFREYGWPGFLSMAVFVGFLTLGFVYLWKRGILEWD